MITEVLLSILLMFNPILLDNDIDIVNDYDIELEYEIKEDDLKDHFNYLNDTINRSERIGYWTCYDYSVDFAKNNPEWKIVTISKTQNFCPKSHMINYQFYDNITMIVYDGLLDNLYYINGWQYDYDYYHFWVDGSQPVRNYRFLVDNRDVVM